MKMKFLGLTSVIPAGAMLLGLLQCFDTVPLALGQQTETSDVMDSDMELVIAPDPQTIRYVEIVLQEGYSLELSDMVVSSIRGSIGKPGAGRATQFDLVIAKVSNDTTVPNPDSVSSFYSTEHTVAPQLLNWGEECTFVDFGVGRVTLDGDIHYCCTDAAFDYRVCKGHDYGHLMVDKAKLEEHNGVHQYFKLPADDDFTQNVLPEGGKLQLTEAGTYMAMFANCDDGGRSVRVSGKLPYNKQYLSLKKFSSAAPRSCCRNDRACIAKSQGRADDPMDPLAEQRKEHNPHVDTVKDVDIVLKPDPFSLQYIQMQMDDREFVERADLHMYTTEDDDYNNRKSLTDWQKNMRTSQVDLVLVPLTQHSVTCELNRHGVGAKIPAGKDGEHQIAWCCTAQTKELLGEGSGLCTPARYGSLIVDFNKFTHIHRRIDVPTKGLFVHDIDENDLWQSGQPGTYVAILANCNPSGRQLHIRGGVPFNPKVQDYRDPTIDKLGEKIEGTIGDDYKCTDEDLNGAEDIVGIPQDYLDWEQNNQNDGDGVSGNDENAGNGATQIDTQSQQQSQPPQGESEDDNANVTPLHNHVKITLGDKNKTDATTSATPYDDDDGVPSEGNATDATAVAAGAQDDNSSTDDFFSNDDDGGYGYGQSYMDFTLQPDPESIQHWQIPVSNHRLQSIDLSGVRFATIDENLNEGSDDPTIVDVLLFHLPFNSYTTPCNWQELGIGKSLHNDETYWCCNDDALDKGLCDASGYGRLLIDRTEYTGEKRKLKFPPTGGLISGIKDADVDISSITADKSVPVGTFVLMMANCNANNRPVTVKGSIPMMTKAQDCCGDCSIPDSNKKGGFRAGGGSGGTGSIVTLLFQLSVIISVFSYGIYKISTYFNSSIRANREEKQALGAVYSDKTSPALNLVAA